MARGIKRSLVSRAFERMSDENDGSQGGVDSQSKGSLNTGTETVTKPKASGGTGSAWKAGAIAQTQAELDVARQSVVDAILSGDRIIELSADQITDTIGTDRRADWRDQEEFRSLVKSIEQNGQDTPVSVWPVDADWRPDELDPANLEGVQFYLLAGRRRCAAAAELGRPVRAVIAPATGRSGADDTFEMLVLRFRENEEREALSPFERLVSIGEMFEALSAKSAEKVTASAFAQRIGVHESLVSRARRVAANKDQILNAFKNAYDMSFQDLQRVVSSISPKSSKPVRNAASVKKLTVKQKVGKQNLVLTGQGGKLTISGSGLELDNAILKGLGEVMAEYLENHRSEERSQ